MRKPLSEYVDPEFNIPSKDPFYKTNHIFNGLFGKNIVIKEDKISSTNVVGFVAVNFSQVVVQKVAEVLGPTDSLLNCGHVTTSRREHAAFEKSVEASCYRCGAMRSYRNFEHEWSHIIFKSSPAMFDRFVMMYSAHFGAHVEGMIRLVVNAFDDLRVNSLWSLVYPGSAMEIEAGWKQMAEASPDLNENFITWIFGVAFDTENLDYKRGPFHDLIPLAKKATEAVKGRGAGNMLLTVRWFLEHCIDRLINPPEEQGEEQEQESGDSTDDERQSESSPRTPETRDEAAQQLSDQTREFNRDQTHYQLTQHDRTVNPLHKLQKSEETALAKIFNTTMMDKQEEIPTLNPHGQQKTPVDGDMEGAIKALQKSNEEGLSKNQFLLSDAAAKVLIADIEPQHISPDSRIVVPRDDEERIDRMRSVFAKYIGKRISRLVDDGDEIDAQALIQYRMDGQDDAVFEDDGLDRGFSYLTLCDMSQSMEGIPFRQVCIGSEMLKKALDYPFVRGHLWGFRGAIGKGHGVYTTIKEKIAALTNGGEVWIYKYHKDCDGYLSKGVEAKGFYSNHKDTIPVSCDGMTPTHTGIHVAVKYLAANTPPGMEKRMFLLTDGRPTQFKVDGKDISHEALMKFVRKEIEYARTKKIKIYTIILGNEITEDEALAMFGPPIFWRRVPALEIGSALLEVVLREFTRFLRR